MELSVRVVEGVAVIRPTGELDHENGPMLAEAVETALADGASSALIDCSALTFVDSMGLRAFIRVREAARAQSGTLTLRDPTPMLLRMLDATGLEDELLVEHSAS